MESLALSIYSIKLSANSGDLTFPLQFWFLLFFFCLIVVAKTSSTVMSKSGESRQICLIPDPKGKSFQLFTTEYNVKRWVCHTSLWLSCYRIHLQCVRPGLNPWVSKIPWRREHLPTRVFWPVEFHGLYSPWGHKESDMTKQVSVAIHGLYYVVVDSL